MDSSAAEQQLLSSVMVDTRQPPSGRLKRFLVRFVLCCLLMVPCKQQWMEPKVHDGQERGMTSHASAGRRKRKRFYCYFTIHFCSATHGFLARAVDGSASQAWTEDCAFIDTMPYENGNHAKCFDMYEYRHFGSPLSPIIAKHDLHEQRRTIPRIHDVLAVKCVICDSRETLDARTKSTLVRGGLMLH